MTKKKHPPAIIDISVICQGCGTELYGGGYAPGIIRQLQSKIRKAGWIHHPEEGTLCPKCLKKLPC